MFWGYIKRKISLSTYHYLVEGASMKIPREQKFRKSKFSRASKCGQGCSQVYNFPHPSPSSP